VVVSHILLMGLQMVPETLESFSSLTQLVAKKILLRLLNGMKSQLPAIYVILK
jgi:hypothetical protein